MSVGGILLKNADPPLGDFNLGRAPSYYTVHLSGRGWDLSVRGWDSFEEC